MASEESTVRRAVQAVRPHLPELLGPDLAGTFGAEIAAVADDEQLIVLVERQPRVREWLADYLEAVSSAPRDYTRLPGDAEFVRPSATFTCPLGTLVWYRRFVGEKPPKCPVHDVDLVRSGSRP
ncbi:hypothetical protein GCM10010172_55180 [Paractinoplanes ferrugineus]|uniref:Uncharacterized protein n=1 Tax=Paractinoplanes ferrugineus TaxID=113564 RepID=A0A919M904_9ACTN|nr:hypothetical protein [Actinoplanes ferrugineus]GIE11011.1 hypothetical protein Afe05nite_28510 [Actinoplanes ferrugineus]